MWLIYAMLAAIIWGLSYILDEQIFKQNVSPFSLLTIQALGGTIIFSLLTLLFNCKKDFSLIANNRYILILTIGALLTFSLGNLFIALSIQAKNATLAAIIENSYPLFTLLFAYLLFKENQLTTSFVIGGLLITSGVLVISVFNK